MNVPASHPPRGKLLQQQSGLAEDPKRDPVLSAKLSIPPVPPVHLPRRRLVELLIRGGRQRLTAVTASAGSGKTVLVSSWARMGLAPGPVAWLTLDTEDNSPAVFWSYLLAALRVELPGLDDSVDTPSHAHSVNRAFLGRLAARLLEASPPAVLVLDRCEHITNRTIAADLDLLLKYSTPGLHLVVVGRTTRLLPLHRYHLAGELTEIATDDLALHPDETARLLERHGLESTAAEIATVHESTEGWITGVCLYALAQQQTRGVGSGSPHPASHHSVGDFLRTEVLDSQPARARDLLLRTSIVDEIHPGLADLLTGRYDARGILEELVRVNAFTQPAYQSWYRVHPLFREVLHDELTARHPDLVRRLHSLAAHWYADRGRIGQAVTHAARVHEWDYATALAVDRLGVARLLTGPDAQHLQSVFTGLPDAQPGERAALIRAALAVARFDTTTAGHELDRAHELATRRPGDRPLAVRLATAILRIVHARLCGDSEAADRAAATADMLFAVLSPDDLPDEPGTRALLLANLGAAQFWAGDFVAARGTLGRAAASTDPMTQYSVHDALGHLAMLELAEGRLHRADRCARESIAVAERAGLRPARQSGTAHAALAAVALQWNDLPAVREHLSRAIAAAGSRHDPATATAIALLHAYAAGGRGDGRRARAAVRSARANLAGWHLTAPVTWQLDMAAVRADFAAGDLAAARRGIDSMPDGPERLLLLARAHLLAGEPAQAARLLADPPPPGTASITLQNHALLRAEIAAAAGDTTAARRALRESLEYARPEHWRRPFAEAGPWLRHLLRQLPELSAEHPWLSPRLGPPEAGPRPTPSIPVEPLTTREIDVLRRLAQALSTDDIATEMHLSINTVKTHLKSIYRKLGTSGRSATARRARELKLIDDHPDPDPPAPPA